MYSPVSNVSHSFPTSRITAFQDTWPTLEEWFGGKQNILVHIDADVEEEELCKRVESVLHQIMLQGQEGN